jgi:hypothetical protein
LPELGYVSQLPTPGKISLKDWR